MDGSATEQLRTWLIETNSSSQLLMETLAKARGLNEKVIIQLQLRARCEERGDKDAKDAARAAGEELLSEARDTVGTFRQFEQLIAQNIQEDQRIIVVDAEGFVLGLGGGSRSRDAERAEKPGRTTAAHHLQRRHGAVGGLSGGHGFITHPGWHRDYLRMP